MRRLRGTVIIAASAALVAAGVLAGAGSAGTNGIGAGNLAFSAIDPSDGMSDIYVMKTDGTARSNITHDTQVKKDLDPTWAPDGMRIVFTRHTAQGGGSNIMLVNADGSGLTSLTSPALSESSNVDPSWSPDGKRIVFASNRDGNYDLYWLNPGSTQAYRLTNTSAPVQNLDPSWSPSGNAIVFSRSGHRAVSASAELYQLKLASIQAGRLTSTIKRRGDRGPVFSPSGNEIAFYSDRTGNDDVYVLHLAGSYVERVAASPKSDTEPTYAPDGSALAFVSNRTGATELWAQNLSGLIPSPSDPVQITNDGQFKSHPSWGLAATQPVPVDDPPAPPVSVGLASEHDRQQLRPALDAIRACNLRLRPGIVGSRAVNLTASPFSPSSGPVALCECDSCRPFPGRAESRSRQAEEAAAEGEAAQAGSPVVAAGALAGPAAASVAASWPAAGSATPQPEDAIGASIDRRGARSSAVSPRRR